MKNGQIRRKNDGKEAEKWGVLDKKGGTPYLYIGDDYNL